METNFQKIKDDVVEKIRQKVPDLSCPICTNKNFAIVGGYFAHDLQDDLIKRHLGGTNVPVVPIACSNCGYMLEFAAGVLGILPKEDHGTV